MAFTTNNIYIIYILSGYLHKVLLLCFYIKDFPFQHPLDTSGYKLSSLYYLKLVKNGQDKTQTLLKK